MSDLLGAEHPLYEVKANLFKGLSHPIRVRILEILSAEDETPVGRLVEVLGMEASHLSQHLAVLRKHHLVLSDRRGSQVYYRLAFPQVADLLRTARALLGEILTRTQRQLGDVERLPGAIGAPTSDAAADAAADAATS